MVGEALSARRRGTWLACELSRLVRDAACATPSEIQHNKKNGCFCFEHKREGTTCAYAYV